MSKRAEAPSSDGPVSKRPRLMAPPDGFTKSRSSKPPARQPPPKFASAFDGVDISSPAKRQQPPAKQTKKPAIFDLFATGLSKPVALNSSSPPPQDDQTPSRPVRHVLKPPVPLFNAAPPRPPPPRPPSPQPARPPPLVPITSEKPGLRRREPPPVPLSPVGPSKPSGLKALVPPPLPIAATSDSERSLRTISTTLLARTTDIFSDSGPAELASILLDPHADSVEWVTPDDLEERRGVMISPQKGKGKEKEKLQRNGLAARAKALFDSKYSSRSLWEAEITHTISSASNRRTSAPSLNPDMRLRIKHILQLPKPASHSRTKPDPTLSIPGIALCHIIAAPSAASMDPYQTPLPRSKDSVCAVLFSFAAIAPPRNSAAVTLTVRNPEDFTEGREVYVWRPWQTLALEVPDLQKCLDDAAAVSEDSPAARARTTSGSDDIYDLFGPTQARARHREKIVSTGLICDRFVIAR